jgi:WD40 repeat protein
VWTGQKTPTGLYSVGLDSQLVSWDLGVGPRTVHESGPDRPDPSHAQQFGALVVGDLQPPVGSNARRELFTADVASGALAVWRAGLHPDEAVSQVVASDDGRIALMSIEVVSGRTAGRNRIEIWDLRAHRDLGRLALPPGTAKFIDGLTGAVSPDGRRAYASLGLQRVGVFALPSGRYLRSFTVHFADPDSGRIQALPWQVDPAGRLVVTGYDPGPNAPEPWSSSGPPLPADQRLALVDVSSGRVVAQVGLGDDLGPSTLGWSHNGQLLAVGSIDGTLGLYDAATLKRRVSAGIVASGSVSTASFAPDDHTLVAGSSDGAASFFDVPDLAREGPRIPISNSANNGGVYAWYAPDGDVVGLAQDERRSDTSQQRWFDFKASPAELARTACALAGSDITPAQWQNYVGDRPYQHVCPATH